MNHSPTAKPDAKPTEGAQGSANSKTPITAHQAQDAIMPSQTVLDAANRFSRENWTNGLRLAGADSSYVAYWSFCAGARQLAQSEERVAKLPDGFKADEVADFLREMLRMAVLHERSQDPAFKAWPDAESIVEHIIKNGCPALLSSSKTN